MWPTHNNIKLVTEKKNHQMDPKHEKDKMRVLWAMLYNIRYQKLHYLVS